MIRNIQMWLGAVLGLALGKTGFTHGMWVKTGFKG